MAKTYDEARTVRWLRPERAFLVIAFVFGQAMVVLIPPFQSADEPTHFFRAFQISEGTFVSHQRDVRGYGGGYLPSSLFDVWLPFSHMGFHPDVKAPVGELPGAFAVGLNPLKRIFMTFPNTVAQFPGCYLPQVAGILIGRILHVGPLAMLYLARECNLLLWVFLGQWSLKTAPAIARPLMLVLLMPMALYVSGTASADVPTDAFAAAFTAIVCGYASAEAEPIDRRWVLLLALLSAAVSTCKFAYGPLLVLLLLIPAKQFGGRRRYWAVIFTVVLVDTTLFFLWSSAAAGLDQQIRMSSDVSARAQLQQVMQHPLRFGPVLVESFRLRGWSYLQGYVGLIGWFDRYVPDWFVVGYLALLFAACLPWDGPAGLPAPAEIVAIVLPAVVISFLIIALLSYLYWTPVGGSFVDGIHGRYLIPLTPAMLILIRSIAARGRGWGMPAWKVNGVFAGISVMACGYFVMMVWERYYG